ncbi:uncharacterized protein LOC143367026 [Andrena cerasifolii]|uniref:uncharacterized protein LOC143367026 n=1 Tax=Andrena cerasifolii TaxID=2819439 RepID=UPI004037D7EA
MEEQTWTVVQFVADGTVDTVPSAWIQGDLCHWPTLTQNRLTNAIKKCEPLNKYWPTYKIKVFRNTTFSNYTKARTKARLVGETRDLQSEIGATNKRKLIEKILSNSDESLHDFSLCMPPKMKKMTSLLEDNSVDVSNNDIKTEIGQNESSLDENIVTESVYADPTCFECGEKNKYLETIVIQTHLIRSLVVDTLQEIKNLRKELQTGRNGRENNSSFFSKYPKLQFPLNSLEDLEELEDILKNEEDFADGVNELANFGGSDNYNFVKRTLSSLITDDVALLFSWLGRKGKKDFHNLTLARLIICAAEKSRMSDGRKETETSIQSWLKRASDRKSSLSKKI